MESSPSSCWYCYLHCGGELAKLPDGTVEYQGGVRDGIVIESGCTYEEFVAMASSKLDIDPTTTSFMYTLNFDPYSMQPLRSDEDLLSMLRFSTGFARVYVKGTGVEPAAVGIEQIQVDGWSGNVDVIGSTRDVMGIPCIERYTMNSDDRSIESYGFSNRCAESNSDSLDKERYQHAILGSGHSFANVNAFRDALYLLSMSQRFRYTFKKNSTKHIIAVCCIPGCKWKITAHAIRNTEIVQVFTFNNEHNHGIEHATVNRPGVRTTRASRLVDDIIRCSPDYPPMQLSKDFYQKYGMRLTYAQAWHFKERSKERIHGSPHNSYKLLPWMCSRIVESNPGSIAECRCNDDGQFVQMFVSLGVSIQGFNMGCRPIISIDSAHMSGPYKGALFSASCHDADDGLFPLAFGVFSSENYEDWLWFLQMVKKVVGSRDVIIISDRHAGLLRSVSEVFGSDNHVHCYRHVKENFSTFLSKNNTKGRKGKENALELLDAIAYARLECDFRVAMANLRLFNPDLAKWVDENGPEHWAMSKFGKMRWDKMSSNLAECFNSWLRHERHHNISSFFHEYLDKIGALLLDHKNSISKWTGCVGPKTEDRVMKNIVSGESYPTFLYLGSSIKVDIGKAFLEVDLLNKTCSCRCWQMSGIPCAHACAGIKRMGLDVLDFVDEYFKKSRQELIYSGSMRPLSTHEMPGICSDGSVRDFEGNGIPTAKPPRCKRPPGRPKKKRIESQFFDKRVLHCSRCLQAGHNRKTCSNQPI